MIIALHLTHVLSNKELHIIHLVACAKTYDELLAWYKSLMVSKYKELVPNLLGGPNIECTKYFKKDSILEWYRLADSTQLNDEHSNTGFTTIDTLEELTEKLDGEVAEKHRLINEEARRQYDHYRSIIEPKMISYDVTQSTATIQ